MKQVFPIQSIGRAASATLLTLVLVPTFLAALVWSQRDIQPAVMAVAAITSLAVATLFLWFLLAQRRSRIEVSDNEINIHIPLYGRAITAGQIVPGSIHAISTTKDTPYRLTWRTNGLGVPGYQLGWFRSAGAGKILAALTTKNAVAFQTKSGFAVLLSVIDPAGLERALRDMNPA